MQGRCKPLSLRKPRTASALTAKKVCSPLFIDSVMIACRCSAATVGIHAAAAVGLIRQGNTQSLSSSRLCISPANRLPRRSGALSSSQISGALSVRNPRRSDDRSPRSLTCYSTSNQTGISSVRKAQFGLSLVASGAIAGTLLDGIHSRVGLQVSETATVAVMVAYAAIYKLLVPCNRIDRGP